MSVMRGGPDRFEPAARGRMVPTPFLRGASGPAAPAPDCGPHLPRDRRPLPAGVPLHGLFRYWMGDERGMRVPEGMRVCPSRSSSEHRLCAVGLAWAMMPRREERGRGLLRRRASCRAAHEAMNFAGVSRPVVFVCQNNQFATACRAAADHGRDHRAAHFELRVPGLAHRRQRPGPWPRHGEPTRRAPEDRGHRDADLQDRAAHDPDDPSKYRTAAEVDAEAL